MQRSAGRLLHASRRQKGAWTRAGAGRKAGRGLRTSVLPVCLMSDYMGVSCEGWRSDREKSAAPGCQGGGPEG